MNTTTSAKARNTDRHVGIDVGKAMLDITFYEVDLYLQEHNCSEGIRRLINRLKRYKLTRILVEATGGYERALVEACVEAVSRRGRSTDAYPSVRQSSGHTRQNRQNRSETDR